MPVIGDEPITLPSVTVGLVWLKLPDSTSDEQATVEASYHVTWNRLVSVIFQTLLPYLDNVKLCYATTTYHHHDIDTEACTNTPKWGRLQRQSRPCANGTLRRAALPPASP